jgi:hypothetical protein
MKLTRPLWEESASFRKTRWIRFGFLSPVAVLAGGIWGSLLGGIGSILAGAGIFWAGAWLHTRMHPALVQWAESHAPGRGRIASFVWDLLVVGGGGLVLTRGLGMPWSPAVGAALGVGGAAAMGFAWFFDEGSTRLFHSLLSPLGRGGGNRPAFSHIDGHLARGDFEGAERALEIFVDAHPRETVGWITLARVLAGPRQDLEGGLRCLEDGLRAVRGSAPKEEELLRQLVVLREGAGEGIAAAPLLARYAERWGESSEGDWARSKLAEVRAALGPPRD